MSARLSKVIFSGLTTIKIERPPQPDPRASLLLRGGGENASTNIVDSSIYNRTITQDWGTFAYSNAYSKYYSTSILGSLPGAASTLLPYTGAYSDWTWESWVYFTDDQITAANSSPPGFLSLDQNCSTVILGYGGVNGLRFGLATPNNGGFWAPSTSSIQANAWQHLAMSFSYNATTGVGTLRSFYNGTLEGQSTQSIYLLPASETEPGLGKIWIGPNTPSFFSNANYYFSDYQIMQGVAKYTTNFTLPTGPLTGTN